MVTAGSDGDDADERAVKRARGGGDALDGVVDRRGRAVRAGERLEVQWEIRASDGSTSETEDEGANGVDGANGADGADADDADDVDGADDGEGVDAAGEGDVALTWWPCTVATEGEDAFLVYDAGAGFEEEKRKVRFIDAWALTHVDDDDDGGVFKWRREGDEDDDEGEDAFDAPTTMREIRAAQDAIDAESGEGLEKASMAAFATLPMNQQMNLASAFAGFKDKLMNRLSSLAAQKGENGVITKDDIENIMSDIRKNA